MEVDPLKFHLCVELSPFKFQVFLLLCYRGRKATKLTVTVRHDFLVHPPDDKR